MECLAIVLDESSPDMQLPGAMKDEMPNKSTSEPADEEKGSAELASRQGKIPLNHLGIAAARTLLLL